MPAFGAADVGVLFQDAGVPVTYNGVTVQGLFDHAEVLERDAQGFQLPIARKVCRIPSGSLTVPIDAAVTIDGTAYVVRDHALEGDGAVTKLIVA